MMASKPGYVWSGTQVSIAATLRRTDTGALLAWSPAVVETVRDGRVTSRARVFTSPAGRIGLRLPVKYTSSFRVRYLGSGGLGSAVSAPVRFVAMPRTSVKYTASTVSVRVSPAAGQRVAVQRLVNGRWRTVASKKVTRSGSASFTRVPAGTLRVYVPRAAGLDDVTSSQWRSR
jgi:hypothetical protein